MTQATILCGGEARQDKTAYRVRRQVFNKNKTVFLM